MNQSDVVHNGHHNTKNLHGLWIAEVFATTLSKEGDEGHETINRLGDRI